MARRQQRSVDIGTLGEDEFKRLCSLEGLIANKATNDRLGWDFLVEIPSQIARGVPLDRHHTQYKALVQVKTTAVGSKAVRGKLSAFKHLVDADIPAFVIHLTLDSTFTVSEMKLLHIGREQISTTLQATRKTESEGQTDIHNSRISLSLKSALLIAPKSKRLTDAIIEEMHEFGEDYIKSKAAFRSACGFDRRSISASFSFPSGIEKAALVDLMLGLRKELPLLKARIEKRRFGIALDTDNDSLGEGSISVDVKPLQTGSIKVFSPNKLSRAELSADLFAPNIPGLERKDFRIRVKNEIFDSILHVGGGSSHLFFRIDPCKKFELGLLSDILNFGNILSQKGASLFFDFPALKEEIIISDDMAGNWQWSLSAEFLNFIASSYRKIHKNPALSLSIEELNTIVDANRDAFATMARAGLKFTTDRMEEMSGNISKYGSIFIPIAIIFQDYVFQAVVRAGATWEDRPDCKIEVVGQKPIVVFEDLILAKEFDCQLINDLSSQMSSTEGGKGRFSIALAIGKGSDSAS